MGEGTAIMPIDKYLHCSNVLKSFGVQGQGGGEGSVQFFFLSSIRVTFFCQVGVEDILSGLECRIFDWVRLENRCPGRTVIMRRAQRSISNAHLRPV